MKHIKTYALGCAAALLLCALAACSGDSGTDTTTTVDNTTETEAVNPLAAADFVPDNISYKGETFTILHGNGWNYTYDGFIASPFNEIGMDADQVEAGDIINEAILQRNRLTEEKLGIKIMAVEKGCFEFNQDVSMSVMAGDNAYDAVCGTVSTVYDCAIQGLLTNLYDIKTLDLTHSWWDQKVLEQYSYGEFKNIVYFINGDINYLDNYGSELMYFNKTMIARYDMESPYELVRNHAWTFDKMLEMSRDIYMDLDNDGTQSFDDQYGIVGSIGCLDRYLSAGGFSIIVPVEDTHYTVNETEPFFTALDTMYDGLANHNSAWFDGGSYGQIFSQGHALFQHNLLSSMSGLAKNMDDDFGAIPFPLYDENQKQYLAPVNTMYGSAYGVVTSTNSDRAGYVLDTMGAFSVDTVTEAVIDKTCLIKNIRDEDTAEMLHIVFDGALYYANSIENWGDTYGVTMGMLANKKNNFASKLKSMKKNVEKESAAEIQMLSNPEY